MQYYGKKDIHRGVHWTVSCYLPYLVFFYYLLFCYPYTLLHIFNVFLFNRCNHCVGVVARCALLLLQLKLPPTKQVIIIIKYRILLANLLSLLQKKNCMVWGLNLHFLLWSYYNTTRCLGFAAYKHWAHFCMQTVTCPSKPPNEMLFVQIKLCVGTWTEWDS